MKKGINQKGRLLTVLDPSYVKTDERTFLDLVQFTLKFAEKVKFFDLMNTPSATWKSMLMSDSVFIIGSIAEMDLNFYKKKHEELEFLRKESGAKKRKSIQEELTANSLSLVKNLFIWKELLIESEYHGALLKEILNASNFLVPRIKRLIPQQHRYSPQDFDLTAEEVIDDPSIDLNESFKMFFKNLMFVQEKASQKFEFSQVEPNFHPPHLGLILSFLKLFQLAQKELNKLLERHLDYYYQEVLGQTEKEKKPATAYVGISSKQLDQLEMGVPVDLTFSNKETMSFHTLTPVNLSAAKISEVWTIYRNSYQPFSDNILNDHSELNSIYDSCLFIGDGQETIDFSGRLEGYPLVMGEDQDDLGRFERNMNPSELGFVITSPVLNLADGKQKIHISIKFTPNSLGQFEEIMQALLSEKEKSEGGFRQEINSFIQAFINDAFIIAITGKDGWVDLDYSYFLFHFEENTLELILEPEGQKEKLVPFDPKIHFGLKGPIWPCIKLKVNNKASLPPMTPLELLEVVEVEVLTKSSEVTSGVQFSNQLGNLDTGNPFQPFGPIPSYDSYLKVKSPLILSSFLDKLSITIYWSGLPLVRGGFETLYEVYPGEIKNDSFKAEILSVDGHLKGKKSDQKTQVFNLFETEKKVDGLYLVSKKQVDVNLDLLNPSIFPALGRDQTNQLEPSFYLKFSEPKDLAFGHDIYPELYTAASVRTGLFFRKHKEIPNVPYTPVIDHFDISYSNRAKENLARYSPNTQEAVKLFHVYPFGYDQVYPGKKKDFAYLLPQINQKGNLLLGLTNVQPNEIISIGIDLIPAYFLHTITKAPKITWEYLEDNVWYQLGNMLLEDSTKGLIHPGIIRIKFPSQISTDNTKLPQGKFWLRISNEGNSDLNARIKSIFINACKIQKSDGSIKQEGVVKREVTKIAIPSVKAIDQVSGPFGLRFLSDFLIEDQLKASTSELLRHRNRAIDGWDIERLILEEFPEIGRVMVYGRSDYPESIVCGSNVQVVVVPASFDSTQDIVSSLRVPFGLLQDIKSYLKGFLSAFSKVEVCNPVFEKLKIRCAVNFTDDLRAGYFRDLLEKELIAFLAPDPVKDISGKGFINSIYMSEIQRFIENRPYVEFVTRLSVLQIIDVQGNHKIIDTAKSEFKIELLRTITPYAILTSAEDHLIEIITEDRLEEPKLAGIGDLTIDSDFIIK